MSSDLRQVPLALEEFTRLHEVTLELRAELDRTVMAFAEVATLEPGSIVRLPSSAGETISLHCGDLRVGSGEVLVVDGLLTVRVSDLATPVPPDSAAQEQEDV